MTTEEWRPLADPWIAGRYEVSDQGRVRSYAPYRGLPVPRILAARTCPQTGYTKVDLQCRNDGDRRKATQAVHRLILLAFVGTCPTGLVVRHLDGDRSHNVLSNLAYGTGTENQEDVLRHGTNFWVNRTHCKHGHEYTPENTATWHWHGRPYRQCIICADIRRTRSRLKMAAMRARSDQWDTFDRPVVLTQVGSA